jgi:hypothetical protein
MAPVSEAAEELEWKMSGNRSNSQTRMIKNKA